MGALARLTGLDRADVSGRLGGIAVSAFGALVALIVAMVFLAVALFAALARPMGEVGAALLTAVIVLLVAGGLALTAYMLLRRLQKAVSRALRTSAAVTAAPVAMRYIGRKAGMIGAVAAVATGFMVGRRYF